MRINGEWLPFDDGVVRPVIRGAILTGRGSWQSAEFLVDTGADRTVFSAATLAALGLSSIPCRESISGLGGMAESVMVETQMRFSRETAGTVVFRGQFAACTKIEALDINV